MSSTIEIGSRGFLARGVRKTFGRGIVLDDLTLEVPRGTTLGLLGANGSGKTTLLKILLGLMPADAGETDIAGSLRVRCQRHCAAGWDTCRRHRTSSTG